MGRGGGRRVYHSPGVVKTPEDILVPSKQPYGKVPVGRSLVGNNEIRGNYGERIPRIRGDYQYLQDLRLQIKSQVASQLSDIRNTLASLSPSDKERFLDDAYQHFHQVGEAAREQFDIYGPKSQQGRVLDQLIRSSVYARQDIESLSEGFDFRPSGSLDQFIRFNIDSPPSDYDF